MPRTYVALDLETTGLDAERDAIIEIGAVKFRDSTMLDTFATFVNPGRHIPRPITELTGIQDSDVQDAPPLHEVLPGLIHFVERWPIVGHSVTFDLSFLRRHSQAFESENRDGHLDTFELASVLLPHAERYSLESLAREVGIEMEQTHRALDDALATYHLFQHFLHQAAQLPQHLLQELVRHSEQGRWPTGAFFHAALEKAASPDHRPHPDKAASMLPPPLPKRPRPLQPAAERTLLDVDHLATLLEAEGEFAAHFPGYEYRPQQISMLRHVAETFNQGEHLLVEAPTGVGKSLAYLIPAVQWAVQNSERVVVSTNTINLQEQLYHKDLPDLERILSTDFCATILKGRSHYLCPARLQAMRRRGAKSADQARVLAKILVWLPETTTGDGDVLFLPNPDERAIWWQLSADHEGCHPERCRQFQQGACYFYRARHAAEASHLVIVNHALLLADVAVQHRALPEYKHLIVDEAHHLEAATTAGLSFETNARRIHRILNEIGQLNRAGRVTGLLADVIGQCQKSQLPDELMREIELLVGKIGLVTRRAQHHIADFFDCLQSFVAEQQAGKHSRYTYRLRITSGLRVQPAWDMVEIAWDDADAPLNALVDGLNQLEDNLDNLSGFDIPDIQDLQAQSLGLIRQLEENRERLTNMITQTDATSIYWLESDPKQDRLSLHAAPLHVGSLVESHLLHEKESIVLTSATLRTNTTFDFLRERLCAWDAVELSVGSPFDYKNSTLVYLIDDIPEPGQQGYQQSVEQGMAALFKATEGRALALFTSYSQLRSTLRAIEAPLEQAGITVQAQGQGISRGQLLDDFRTGQRRVLLGTRSFWEGVDVPGEALSCLAIAKLPFSVPSDPIFAARAETFDQPFFEYAVPEAILRFLQGFGRLIRTRTDRGVVAIFDKRLLSKSYGTLFIDSLPDPTIRQGSLTLLPSAAAEWLSR